jgi:hypothetical protein
MSFCNKGKVTDYFFNKFTIIANNFTIRESLSLIFGVLFFIVKWI